MYACIREADNHISSSVASLLIAEEPLCPHAQIKLDGDTSNNLLSR
jgi:hypothetical protein